MFYVLLNEPVRNHWLVKFGLKETTSSRRSNVGSPPTPKTNNVYVKTGASTSVNTGASTSAAGQELHIIESAKFPAKSDKNDINT